MIEEPNNQIPDDTPNWMRDMKPQPRRNPELPRPAQPANNPQSGPVSQPRTDHGWGRLAIELFGAEYLELSYLLNLLRPSIWDGWIHEPHKGGWYHSATKAFMSYKGARIVINARIAELGLNAELVYAAPHTVPQGNWREQNEAWARFNRLSFDKQMDEFRRERQ